MKENSARSSRLEGNSGKESGSKISLANLGRIDRVGRNSEKN